MGVVDANLAYGEVKPQPFIQALTSAWDLLPVERRDAPVFVDFGSGLGQGILMAASWRKWGKLIGIETIRQLHEAAEQALTRWQSLIEADPAMQALATPASQVELVCGDFTSHPITECDVWLANSTCFTAELLESLANTVSDMPVGTIGITLTKKLPSYKWEVVSSTFTMMSWGPATVHIQRKLM